MAIPLLLCVYYLSYFVISIRAQSISTSIPVPPLQWINLSTSLHGSTVPPPLQGAALGYDESSRSLIVFGGESEGGFVQSQTYLLNMDTLTWSIPTPPPNLAITPPARSSAISAMDVAASNRHAFIVIGGRGSNNAALSDVWAFDFTNQFWSQVLPTHTGPSPRWGASGGIDIRVPPVQDAILPGPNNTVYLAGGFDGNQIFPLSDVWRLNISGTLSANLPNSVMATWENIHLDRTLPSKIRQGGSISNQQIISFGGCNSSLSGIGDVLSCPQQDSYVVDAIQGTSISPGPCPAPRLDPVLISNFNSYSTNFASQVFLVLGTFNDTIWDDGGGLRNGEIDILDVNTGTWSRIMPSGDPGSPGGPTYPTPRGGASAFAYNRALVGTMRNGISDTVVFGGRDYSGRYLSDVWLLRSYQDSLTSSQVKWSGFGGGALQTGINANGSGVIVEYLTACPVANAVTASPSDAADPGMSQPPPSFRYETGLIHKLFTSLSLALLFLSFLFLRVLSSSSVALGRRHQIATLFVALFTIGAYVIGVVGFIFAFTSLKVLNPSDATPHHATHLTTSHGDAGFALFICLYCIVPGLLAWPAIQRIRGRKIFDEGRLTTEIQRTASETTNEKPDPNLMIPHSPSVSGIYSPPGSPRPRTQSTTYPHRSLEGMSTDGESTASGPRRGFEVLNRPANRPAKQRDSWPSQPSHPMPSSRTLGDIDWLLRRRSLNAVGELDYALSLAHNAQRNSATTAEVASPFTPPPYSRLVPRPPLFTIVAYILVQVGFLGLNVTTLVALWQHAPLALFIIFLISVLLFCILIIWMPQRFDSESYILSILFQRRNSNATLSQASPTPPHSYSLEPTVTLAPPPSHGPYLHAPPFSRTVPGNAACSLGGALGVEEEEEEEEMDEITRQRMIEEEMDRREVSIITMPKRKLWVVNPS